jgi:hypothetical protein
MTISQLYSYLIETDFFEKRYRDFPDGGPGYLGIIMDSGIIEPPTGTQLCIRKALTVWSNCMKCPKDVLLAADYPWAEELETAFRLTLPNVEKRVRWLSQKLQNYDRKDPSPNTTRMIKLILTDMGKYNDISLNDAIDVVSGDQDEQRRLRERIDSSAWGFSLKLQPHIIEAYKHHWVSPFSRYSIGRKPFYYQPRVVEVYKRLRPTPFSDCSACELSPGHRPHIIEVCKRLRLTAFSDCSIFYFDMDKDEQKTFIRAFTFINPSDHIAWFECMQLHPEILMSANHAWIEELLEIHNLGEESSWMIQKLKNYKRPDHIGMDVIKHAIKIIARDKNVFDHYLLHDAISTVNRRMRENVDKSDL